jgi:hypothetical protein
MDTIQIIQNKLYYKECLVIVDNISILTAETWLKNAHLQIQVL